MATQRQGRYGVAYVRSVCTQFGVGFGETSADEDTIGVDGQIEYEVSPLRIQIKCTTKAFTKQEPHISWPIKDKWAQLWSGMLVHPYLVVVQVPEEPADWIDYEDGSTLHHTSAYWAPLDRTTLKPLEKQTSIHVPKRNLFTPETVGDWEREIKSQFMGGE
nr:MULTISPECIES: DUF4365 domain-containing protein [unclassified Brevibacterium]